LPGDGANDGAAGLAPVGDEEVDEEEAGVLLAPPQPVNAASVINRLERQKSVRPLDTAGSEAQIRNVYLPHRREVDQDLRKISARRFSENVVELQGHTQSCRNGVHSIAHEYWKGK